MALLSAVLLPVLISIVILSTRRGAALGMLAAVLFFTQGQQLEVLGININVMRVVELAAFLRVVGRRELSLGHLTALDRNVVLLYSYTTVVFVVRSDQGQQYQIGQAVDAWLCYFAFRGLIRTVDDFRWCLKGLLFVLAPFAALVLIESSTGHNVFAATYDEFASSGVIGMGWSRGDSIRSVGSFRHPSLLGIVGAVFLPLYVAEWFARRRRWVCIAGAGLCAALVWASNSGAPLMCAGIGIAGWLMWPLRGRMRTMRFALVGTLVALILVMKAPIWYLISKAGSASGGHAFHRARLVDMAFKNLNEWWLAGMRVQDTSDWFPYVLSVTGGADIANNYLVFGITAGLGAMFIFFALLKRAFGEIGARLAELRMQEKSSELERVYWGLGVMLLVHTAAWLGTSYFDQTYVVWFFHLAAIAALFDAGVATDPLRSRSAPGSALSGGSALRLWPSRQRSGKARETGQGVGLWAARRRSGDATHSGGTGTRGVNRGPRRVGRGGPVGQAVAGGGPPSVGSFRARRRLP